MSIPWLKRLRTTTATGLRMLGLDFRNGRRHLASLPRFLRDIRAYRRAAANGAFPFRWRHLSPVLLDYRAQAGTARGHYFHQDLWAARRILAAAPARHVDIGSRIDGFVAHLLAFRAVEVIDIRPLTSQVAGLSFIQADASSLDGIPDGSIPSLSCLHAIEHFGLGRYGDPIDADACFKGLRAIQRVLAPGGRLYLSAPIGVERVEFNAQRIFAPSTFIRHLTGLRLISFSAVDDRGDLVSDTEPEHFAGANNACGLYEFTKDAAG
jgi:hypothetical protein